MENNNLSGLAGYMASVEEGIRDSLLSNATTDFNIKLTDFIDVSILQKMQDAFSNMARMAAVITDVNGVPITNGSNFTDFCMNHCRKSEIGCARCEQCDIEGAKRAVEQKTSVSYKCHAGLTDFAAPIMLGEKLVGSFVGGQVLAYFPDEAEIRKVAREIEVDEDALWEAAMRVQVIPQSAIDRSTKFVYEFARIISDMVFQNYVTKELSKEAMQAAVQKQDFLANMSHEIRTPMNAVLGMAEMALREDMSPAAKEYIAQIQSAGKQLLVIINDILDYSKVDSGKMKIVESIYETEALLADVSNVVNSRIGSKKIEFMIDAPYDMPVEMFGDYVRIQQVLVNLLNNAVKFTEEGYIKLQLSFEPIDDGHVTFKASVIDTGHGIRKEDLKKLFSSFQQVDSKRNRKVEGTGLGLAISKQLVELMGGHISVSSVYGKGSTFTVEFPQKVQTKAEPLKIPEKPLKIYFYTKVKDAKEQVRKDISFLAADIVEAGDPTSDIAPEDGSFAMMYRRDRKELIEELAQKLPGVTFIVVDEYNAPNDLKGPNIRIIKKPGYSKALLAALGLTSSYTRDQESDEDIFSFIAPDAHVLVVDDNEINLSVAKGLMEPLKMKVDTALSAMECIKLIQKTKYDLIFMDHMMPEVDGIETTHIIRRMYSAYADTPIIALTANAVGGAKEMFIEEGMNDFVAKPIETQKIVAKVRQWLPSEKIVPVDRTERGLTDSLSEDSVLRSIAIPELNVEGAIKLLRNEKLYLQFLKEYYLSIDAKAEKIRKVFEMGDIKTYTIEVHALKSSSRQIGAEALSKKAERLEKAGNDKDLGTILAETEELLADYRALEEKLAVVFAKDDNGEKDDKSLTLDKVITLCEEITDALNQFDFLAVDDALSKLDGYEFTDENEAMLIEQIKICAGEFDTDNCFALMDEWKKMYQKG